jgi:hypothetical protein
MAAVARGTKIARLLSLAAVSAASCLLFASGARSVEALDGRVQFHGFTELQLRALNEKFDEELDLAQWYNVLNLELEFDIAPDGIGPIDLMSAYVRAEARYDAIYSNGFYMFPSIDTYGDESENLPKRLRDGEDKEMGGVIRASDRFGEFKARRITDRDPTALVPPVINVPPGNITLAANQNPFTQFPNGVNVAAGGPDEIPAQGRQSNKGERRGYPGFDTFFRQAGPDDQFGTADDPARYVHEHVSDFKFTFRAFRGPIGNDNMIMGPWLPKNFIRSVALNTDRANPFRGRVAPTQPLRVIAFDSFGAANPTAIRFHDGDILPTPLTNPVTMVTVTQAPNLSAILPIPAPGQLNFAAVDLLDPVLARILTAPDNIYLDLRTFPSVTVPATGRAARLNQTFPGRFTPNPIAASGLVLSPDLTNDLGGDFMGGVVPCADPTNDLALLIRSGATAADPLATCIESSSILGGPGTPIPGAPGPDANGAYTPPGLTEMTGGKGETPFRPAPDLPNLGQRLIARDSTGAFIDAGLIQGLNSDLTQAQGLYVPSKGTIRELEGDDLDSLQFNYDEVDRSWNRGQSQENNKELKEAYVDVEVLDSRLWMRFGLQNIVWGKTELFRTTDQFNPQDLALASLPSLEESRIALWSARFVYSLYDVGPLEDVRLEFATNIDQYQPSDLGACGEPFTPDVVCTLTNGIFAHSLVGVGVVGIDRPESPWKDLSDLEVGGRIEWRWDRFSFALMNFWGFSDFPHTESVYYYERGVDFESGRPVVGRLPKEDPGRCGLAAGENAPDRLNGAGLRYNSSFASHPFSVTPGAEELVSIAPLTITKRRGGVGMDPGCLRPGGAPGGPNAFAFDTDTLSETNALQNHHANQQIFAWICAGTVGIAASLDAGSCAWTVFASDAVLNRQLLPVSFIESLTALFAGEQTGTAGPQRILGLVSGTTKGAVVGSVQAPVPLAALNMLFNRPTNPFDRNLDGDNTDTTDCDDPTDLSNCDLGGFDGFDGRTQLPGRVDTPQFDETLVADFLTLDKSLTNEQRALLGCGPFYASRCDSSLPFRNSGQDIFFGNYGGLDFMNMEASALVQSWIGVEGSQEGDFSTSTAIQPGTVGWVPVADRNGRFEAGNRAMLLPDGSEVPAVGGPICTRFQKQGEKLIKLPGCRGVESLRTVTLPSGDPQILISFEPGYLPSIDGCVIGTRVNRTGGGVVDVVLDGDSAGNAQLQAELALCNGATTKRVVPRNIFVDADLDGDPDTINGLPVTAVNPACDDPANAVGSGTGATALRVCRAQTLTLEDLPLLHPTAGCVASDSHFPVFGAADCRYWMNRDLVEEFFDGTAQLFQNELAAFSWNFLMFLTVTSCNITSFDLDGNDHRLGLDNLNSPQAGPRSLQGDPGCFDPRIAWDPSRCSIAAPQYCNNVKGFLTAAGVMRNATRAGGNSRYGRRTFLWHSGGELTLGYEQRNVMGLSADFAEDVTKTNWGMEFTWSEDVPFANVDSMVGVSSTDSLALTLSVDRPTFINFLNPNRTFFFNSQWFFLYLTDWENGYTFNGPWNVLFTFAMFTGYFQDRVQPQFVTVYDFRSQSGGLLPSFQYRFTESFSVTIGMLYFIGRTELKDMGVREYAPAANRAGPNAYENGQDNLLSLIRQRDEVFMRLRWTF